MAAGQTTRTSHRPRSTPNAIAAPATGGARGTEANAAGRRTFVLAFFSNLETATGALKRMSAYGGGGKNILLVTQHTFPGLIATQPPFDRIWSSLSERAETTIGGTAPRGNDRLVRDLAHRIANGAALVIAAPENQSEQRSISRVLLDSSCEMLLTHEVTASGRDATMSRHYSFTT